MTRPHILVAGIGNIFMGDDAFGSEVARRLAERMPPDKARVVDFGVRGFDLACALMDGYEVTILVDVTPRGGAAGALYVIEPDLNELDAPNSEETMIDMHGLNPMKALSLVKAMGGEFKRILLVGCEPATIGADEEQMGLSKPVRASVDETVALIESLISEHARTFDLP